MPIEQLPDSKINAQQPKASKRIVSFDLLRGYFLCVILLNHLDFAPNGLSFLTGRGFLYASTAEGFLAISGIILGIVRGHKLLHAPLKEATKLLWKRALQLYITSIILTIFFTLFGQFFLGNPGLKYGIYSDWTHWWNFLLDVLTMRYSYGWADFLRFYALFLFFAPAALWLLRKGYWYLLIIISLGVWALYPLLPSQDNLYQPVSWQLIFFLGFTVGYHWESILLWFRLLPRKLFVAMKIATVVLFILTFVASYIIVFGAQAKTSLGSELLTIHSHVEVFFNKDSMPITRIALGTVWFWGLFIICRRFEKAIYKGAGWLLYEFGSHSLYVYTLSAFVVFFMHLFVAPSPGFNSVWLNLLFSLLAIALVWVALKKRFLIKIIPR